MKRKHLFVILSSTVLALAAAVTAFSYGTKLSPALDIISETKCMTKTGLLFSDVKFKEEDFTAAIGIEPSSVTFTSLPSAADGTLCLSTRPVSVNQTVSRANLDLLRFIPSGDVRETSFRFTTDRSYTVACYIKLAGEVNRAPVTSSGDAFSTVSLITTERDVTCYGTLTGSDPDGDKVTFEITKYPGRGLLTLTDLNTGEFCYTPYEGTVGADSFSYRVFDEYGNYSDEADVTVRTSKRSTGIELSDMTGHWGQNAALAAVGIRAMTVTERDGKYLFEPDEAMSREDYLVTVMKSLGAGELSPVKTVFADDADISDGASGYVAAAYRIGIITGDGENEAPVFRPDDPVTRAEAAVILNRIIGDKRTASIPAADDAAEVPAWAEADVAVMLAAGVMNRSDCLIVPDGGVTRAEAAQMVYNVRNLYLS
ncbi:MAG: S-layer homology domain-containing protein [Clostridia bacterium]|nr:S-layer homology domain-containing protein [Clostridia bacterium]